MQNYTQDKEGSLKDRIDEARRFFSTSHCCVFSFPLICDKPTRSKLLSQGNAVTWLYFSVTLRLVSRHSLSRLSPPALSLPCSHLPIRCLDQTFGIPLNSILTPTYGPSFANTSSNYFAGGNENHPPVVCGQPNLASSGVKMFKLPHQLQFVKFPPFCLILRTLSAYVGPNIFLDISF